MGRITISALLFVLMATGCDNGSSGDNARVRLVQASTMGQSLSLFVDQSLNATLPYGEFGSYEDADDSAHTLIGQVNSATVFSVQASFDTDEDYTVLTVPEGAITTPVIFLDDNGRPDVGNAKLRVINASSRAQSVDIYALREGETVDTHEANFSGVQFKSASNYDQLDRNEYVIWVTSPGTKTVLASAASQDLKNLDTWTALVFDSPGASGVTVVLHKDEDGEDLNL